MGLPATRKSNYFRSYWIISGLAWLLIRRSAATRFLAAEGSMAASSHTVGLSFDTRFLACNLATLRESCDYQPMIDVGKTPNGKS